MAAARPLDPWHHINYAARFLQFARSFPMISEDSIIQEPARFLVIIHLSNLFSQNERNIVFWFEYFFRKIMEVGLRVAPQVLLLFSRASIIETPVLSTFRQNLQVYWSKCPQKYVFDGVSSGWSYILSRTCFCYRFFWRHFGSQSLCFNSNVIPGFCAAQYYRTKAT